MVSPLSAPSTADSFGAGSSLAPDLLFRGAALRFPREGFERDLAFAFAGSSQAGFFAEALERSRFPESTFRPESFARELFLEEFLRACFSFEIRGRVQTPHLRFLGRVLVAPPPREDGEFRKAIVAELDARPELVDALRDLYVALGRLRTLLETTSVLDQRAPTRRQLDVLEAFRALVELAAERFVDACSGLDRIHRFAARIRGSEAFGALVELLRFEESMAEITFRVGIGSDGRVRKLEMLRVEEATDNVFHLSPWRRWASRLELLWRGFRFGDAEVLARLVDAAFDGVTEFIAPLAQLLGDVEFYLGSLSFRDRCRSRGLSVSLPEEANDWHLEGLFNPLLVASGQTAVSCSLEFDASTSLVLLTGPNSGGKTRLLQSLGLAQLLAHGGTFVPAARARVPRIPALVVSLLEETRIDQTEGRLGVELVRIRALFEELPPGAMVILDELCSGTNPTEGEEIVELVLRMLARLSTRAFITTHFLEFASRLARENSIPELRYLRVVLGPEHRPTYQFEVGVAESSLAAEAAMRLGVTGEQLLAIVEAKLRASEARGR